jgi:hypothetical protein
VIKVQIFLPMPKRRSVGSYQGEYRHPAIKNEKPSNVNNVFKELAAGKCLVNLREETSNDRYIGLEGRLDKKESFMMSVICTPERDIVFFATSRNINGLHPERRNKNPKLTGSRNCNASCS